MNQILLVTLCLFACFSHWRQTFLPKQCLHITLFVTKCWYSTQIFIHSILLIGFEWFSLFLFSQISSQQKRYETFTCKYLPLTLYVNEIKNLQLPPHNKCHVTLDKQWHRIDTWSYLISSHSLPSVAFFSFLHTIILCRCDNTCLHLIILHAVSF